VWEKYYFLGGHLGGGVFLGGDGGGGVGHGKGGEEEGC
jgi:hypothetical protein